MGGVLIGGACEVAAGRPLVPPLLRMLREENQKEEAALGRGRFVSADIVLINHENGDRDNLRDTIS